jgi:23S rRNA pseudouridine1911/1915/1917 synthase
LNGGDRVHVELPDPPDPATLGLAPEPLPLDIVFEDEHVIVVDKPAGLVVHPGAGVARGTLVHALLHHAPGIVGVGGSGRPGIVHRLDKGTSGLLVVAKTDASYRNLIEAMRSRAVTRDYLALIWGDPGWSSQRVEAPIGRHPRDRKRMAVTSRGGRPAATRFEVAERFGEAALVRARLETGRTHQIRVHLGHLGHPVVADPVYGGTVKKLLSPGLGPRSLRGALLEHLSHQALHAAELRFLHPITGEALHFTAPVPEDFARALELLRAGANGRH